MKKLTLKVLELGADELLTRSQMKRVQGGLDDSGSGASGKCSTSQCTFTKQMPDGNWDTASGWCKIHVKDGGVFGYDEFTCYCATSLSSETTPVTSNGGQSRCNL